MISARLWLYHVKFPIKQWIKIDRVTWDYGIRAHQACVIPSAYTFRFHLGIIKNLLTLILLACLKISCCWKTNHLLFLAAEFMSSCKPLTAETALGYLDLELQLQTVTSPLSQHIKFGTIGNVTPVILPGVIKNNSLQVFLKGTCYFSVEATGEQTENCWCPSPLHTVRFYYCSVYHSSGSSFIP